MKISRKRRGRRRSGGAKPALQARVHETHKSSASPQSELLNLQRTIGNSAVQRLYETGQLQAKLKIGAPGDRYEREADSVADRVMSMGNAVVSRQQSDVSEDKENKDVMAKPLAESITPLVQREAGPEEEIQEKENSGDLPLIPSLQRRGDFGSSPLQGEVRRGGVDLQREAEEEVQGKFLQREAEEEEVQKQPEEEEEKKIQPKGQGGGSSTASSSVESGINSLRGGGQPLPESSRAFFEPRFGADFSGVRVHTGSNANYLARSVNAKAFTLGQNVVFGSGQYSPNTTEGKRLMAHELAHTVQQGKGNCSRSVGTFHINRWALAGTLGKLCPDKDGKKSIKILNSEGYKVYSYGTYTYKRQHYTDAAKTTKMGAPKQHTINGYHTRSKKEIAMDVKRSDDKAASTLVHEVVHAGQHMKYEAEKIKNPLAVAPTKAQKEYEAHIKQEEFNIRNSIPAKHASFRKLSGGKWVVDEPAIRKWVDRVYAIGPKKFYTNYGYNGPTSKTLVAPWACP